MESVIKGLHFVLTLCIVVLRILRRRLGDPASISLRHLYFQARSLGDGNGPTQKELQRIRKKILAALACGQRSVKMEMSLELRIALEQAFFKVKPGEEGNCTVSW